MNIVRVTKKLKSIRYYLGIILLDIVVVELILWLFFPYNTPSLPRNKETFVVSSPTRVHQFIANSSFTYDGADYQTNSLGYRDREYSMTKPANTQRIVFFGDSFIEGFGEKQDQTIPKQLESQLISTGKKVEVMNCGIRGGSPATYFFWIKQLEAYLPDTVIMGIGENDMDDDACALITKAYYRAKAWDALPKWMRTSNIAAYIDGEIAAAWFKIKRKRISQDTFGDPTFLKDDQHKDPKSPSVGKNAFGFLNDPEGWKVHWQRTERNLDLIRDEMKKKNIKLLVVFIPNQRRGLKQNPFADWLSVWTQDRQVPYLNLFDDIQAWEKDWHHKSLYDPKTGHFTTAGAGWVAEKIKGELK